MKMNRRQLLSFLGVSPALAAGSLSEAQAPPKKGQKPAHLAGAAGDMQALNPKGAPPPVMLVPMAPRLDNLEGKTVYLVDTGFMGGGTLLLEMQAWFKQNMPTVTTVFRKKAGSYMEEDPPLWKEIKEKGNAAIMAVGH
jgi:hypothetical protein